MGTITSSRLSSRVRILVCAAILYPIITGTLPPAYAQGFDNFTQGHGRNALKVIKKDIEKNYYDPTFGGIDLEEHFNKAKEKIDAATSTSQLFGIIAQALVDFDDSHTYFTPPGRASRTDYGWEMQMIGDKCFVVTVDEDSDAEAKGLKVGDQVLAIGGYGPTRQDLWKIQYLYYLRPQPSMHIGIQSLDGQERALEVMADYKQGRRDAGSGYAWQYEFEELVDLKYEDGDHLIIWKMPTFSLSTGTVDKAMDKIRKFNALILDLRGNGGGAVRTLERLTGYFFDNDLNVADLKGRKKIKPMVAKTRGKRTFKGTLVVLVDSESASASELFARVVQLEQRGVVIGDRTSGSVMQSRHYEHKMGVHRVFFYGASITNADVIMADGKSLEKVGVTPDEVILPTVNDLASEHDPVLARAMGLVGTEIEPKEAGALSFSEWLD